MKFEFDEVQNRRNTNSLKWDVAENELPMWVADMDFKTAPAIRKAMQKRLDGGIFGYSDLTDEWYEAYQKWWKTRHDFDIKKEWLVFATGVIPGLSSAVRKLTTPGENVVIMTPVYNIFYNSILNNGRNVLESELKYDGENYEIDFEDLEEKLSNPQTSLMFLCNPHNPVGKIWNKETLARIGELCKKHYVTVISDEIHCDLVAPGQKYVPFATASETCKEISVTCIAPTKAFNIAGLHTAAVVAANPSLRHKMWRQLNTDEVGEPNAFSVDVAVAAFNEGGEWLDALREYIQDNKKTVVEFINNNIPELKIVSTDATYLLWIDCAKLGDNVEDLAQFIRKKTGLYLTAGKVYGNPGKNFMRMNVACPRTLVNDGLNRLKKGIELFKQERQ